MTRVLVVCGAGASSTFLVHRMRAVAAERVIEMTFVAGVLADVATRAADVDLVLVGHHLEQSFAEISAAVERVGGVAALLPALNYDTVGAEAALDVAASALRPQATQSRPTDQHDREPENIHG